MNRWGLIALDRTIYLDFIFLADAGLQEAKDMLNHCSREPQSILRDLPRMQDLKANATALSQNLGYMT
jgi:hypothetical protein